MLQHKCYLHRHVTEAQDRCSAKVRVLIKLNYQSTCYVSYLGERKIKQELLYVSNRPSCMLFETGRINYEETPRQEKTYVTSRDL